MPANPPVPCAPIGRLARVARVAATGALLALAACGAEPPAESADGEDALTSDSSLKRDLTLAQGPAGDVSFGDTLPVAGAAAESAASEPQPSPGAPPRAARRVERPAARPASPPRPTVPREPPGAALPRAAEAAPREPARAPVDTPAPAAPPTPRSTDPSGRGGRAIGAGTVLAFTTQARICTATNAPGDKIVATLDAPATGSSGFTLPAGTKAVLELATVERDAGGDPTGLTFRVRNLDDGSVAYQAAGDVTTADSLRRSRSNRNPAGDRRKVVGGAVLGAVLGQVLGKDTKGTVIGAAAGGAIGAAGAARGARYEACLPAGAKVQLRLSAPIVP